MREDLNGLDAFLAVAEKLSFRAAGEELRVTASAVSQTVSKLEDRLGLQLFARTTRSVALTEAGERLRARLRPAFAEMRAALEDAHELRGRPAGRLRLSVSSIAETFLSQGFLADFLDAHPDIELDIAIDDGEPDIVKEGFDAGVRLGEVVTADMIAVNVTKEERQIVVASPGYLAKHGKPRHPRDLHRHACIGWRRYDLAAPYRWELTENGKDFEMEIRARVNSNAMHVMTRLALDGVGLTLGLERTFRSYIDDGRLVPLLLKYCAPFPGFFLYYPRSAKLPRKLRALVDFVKARSKAPSRRLPARRAADGGGAQA